MRQQTCHHRPTPEQLLRWHDRPGPDCVGASNAAYALMPAAPGPVTLERGTASSLPPANRRCQRHHDQGPSAAAAVAACDAVTEAGEVAAAYQRCHQRGAGGLRRGRRLCRAADERRAPVEISLLGGGGRLVRWRWARRRMHGGAFRSWWSAPAQPGLTSAARITEDALRSYHRTLRTKAWARSSFWGQICGRVLCPMCSSEANPPAGGAHDYQKVFGVDLVRVPRSALRRASALPTWASA